MKGFEALHPGSKTEYLLIYYGISIGATFTSFTTFKIVSVFTLSPLMAAYDILPCDLNSHLFLSIFKVFFINNMSSIGNRHSRLSSFGTSKFFEKNLCTRTGIFFIRYLGSSGPHLPELLLYSGLSLLHAAGYWCPQTSGRTSKPLW